MGNTHTQRMGTVRSTHSRSRHLPQSRFRITFLAKHSKQCWTDSPRSRARHPRRNLRPDVDRLSAWELLAISCPRTSGISPARESKSTDARPHAERLLRTAVESRQAGTLRTEGLASPVAMERVGIKSGPRPKEPRRCELLSLISTRLHVAVLAIPPQAREAIYTVRPRVKRRHRVDDQPAGCSRRCARSNTEDRAPVHQIATAASPA